MDALLLTLLLISFTCLLLGFAGGLLWIVEHTTWKHVFVTTSLILTLGSLAAGLYAYWHTFGWWSLALVGLGAIHGGFVSWFTFNSDKPQFNQPIYRVGGGNATPRLHR